MLRRYKFKNIELINNEEKKERAQYYYWVIFQIGRDAYNWKSFVRQAYGIYTPLTNKYFENKMTKSRRNMDHFTV